MFFSFDMLSSELIVYFSFIYREPDVYFDIVSIGPVLRKIFLDKYCHSAFLNSMYGSRREVIYV